MSKVTNEVLSRFCLLYRERAKETVRLIRRLAGLDGAPLDGPTTIEYLETLRCALNLAGDEE